MKASTAEILVVSLVLIANGAPTECEKPVVGEALLQVSHANVETLVSEDAEHQDPGHRVLLLAQHHANGTYTVPAKLGHMSQMQQSARSGTGNIPVEMQEVLDWHNMYRCMHNVPLMTWDEDIAANAQAWADAGYYGHSAQAARTLPNIGYVGENLAWGYPTRSGKDSVEAWYDEIVYTDGAPENCDDTNQEGNEQICHYTQVVWKSSTKLGCGKGKATVSYPSQTYDGDFWVCQYGPGGNYDGQFTSNVVAPAKTTDECQTPADPPTPAPTPAPGSEIVEVTHDPDCTDGAASDNPIINYNGGPASCPDIAWACPFYGFVQAKCKKSCESC